MKPSDAAAKILGPRWAVGVFVASLLVPNLVLAYTEPYSFTTVVASILLPGGFYLLWSGLSLRYGPMILWGIPCMALAAFQLVITYLFGNSVIAVDMFTNLFTTSVSEAGELLGIIYPSIIIVCLLYIPVVAMGIMATARRASFTRRGRQLTLMAGALGMLAGIAFAFVSDRRNEAFEVKYHIYPANVIYNAATSIGRWRTGNGYPGSAAGFAYGASRTERPDTAVANIYLLVIGEASRAASWGLYGYEKPTNPLLSARRDLAVFRDVLTESNTTHKSVPIILSSVSAVDFSDIYRQKSVISLFREAGIRTAFVSNQPQNRSLIDHYAASVDTTIFTADRSSATGEPGYDGVMLPHLESLLAGDADRDIFIVLHMYGSHASYHKRYPEEYSVFTPDNPRGIRGSSRGALVNSYDNSVVYTDALLNSAINILNRTGRPATMLFISDHGEDLLDDERRRFLHSSPTTTYYQLHVPALLWMSEEFAATHPGKRAAALSNVLRPASTASIFHTLADLADIDSPYADRGMSLVEKNYRGNTQRHYLNDHELAIPVLRSGLTREDLRLFDTYGIAYVKDGLKEVRY